MEEKKTWTKPVCVTLTKEEINNTAQAAGCSEYSPDICPFTWVRDNNSAKE